MFGYNFLRESLSRYYELEGFSQFTDGDKKFEMSQIPRDANVICHWRGNSRSRGGEVMNKYQVVYYYQIKFKWNRKYRRLWRNQKLKLSTAFTAIWIWHKLWNDRLLGQIETTLKANYIYIYEAFIGNEIWQTQRWTIIRDRGTNK